MTLNVKKIRRDFPILSRKVHGKPLAYLDNAATTQKPRQVIEAITTYYGQHNANVHRSVHQLGEEATEAYEGAHKDAASFIGSPQEKEIVFTKNTTESLNILANGIPLAKGDEVVLTQMEHHSNIVPWLNVAKRSGAKIRYAKLDSDGSLSLSHFGSLLTKRTKVVSFTHMSNVLGTINPVAEMTKMAHECGALAIIDGAQSAPHMPVDVRKIGCDAFAFSAHKMLGPTGLGVLYAKEELLERMDPLMFGGDMIKEVRFDRASWNDVPWKFEAGTPHVAGAVGLSAAITYLMRIGLEAIQSHERKLTAYAMRRLTEIRGLTLYGPALQKRGGVFSFTLERIHPHDAATILDRLGIAVRGGHHCAMPLMNLLGIAGSTRASIYLYNTPEEIDRLVAGIRHVQKVMGV